MKKFILIIALVFAFTACQEETTEMQQFRGKTVSRILECSNSYTVEFTDGTSLDFWSSQVIFKSINKK